MHTSASSDENSDGSPGTKCRKVTPAAAACARIDSSSGRGQRAPATTVACQRASPAAAMKASSSGYPSTPSPAVASTRGARAPGPAGGPARRLRAGRRHDVTAERRDARDVVGEAGVEDGVEKIRLPVDEDEVVVVGDPLEEAAVPPLEHGGPLVEHVRERKHGPPSGRAHDLERGTELAVLAEGMEVDEHDVRAEGLGRRGQELLPQHAKTGKRGGSGGVRRSRIGTRELERADVLGKTEATDFVGARDE